MRQWTPVIVLLLFASAASAAPFDGALALTGDNYAWLEDDPVFADFSEGMTVEGWFYFTREPERSREAWVLIDNPPFYRLQIHGGVDLPYADDIDTVAAYRLGGGESSYVFRRGQFPLNRWVHIGFQARTSGATRGVGRERWDLFDGESLGRSEGCCVPSWEEANAELRRGPTQLLVGGREVMDWGWRVDRGMEGYVDEMRFTRGLRYGDNLPRRADVNPQRNEPPDGNTIALWTFDEMLPDASYADVSGNGFRLKRFGVTSVSRQGKATTSWAALKEIGQ